LQQTVHHSGAPTRSRMIRKGRPRILFGELDHDTPVIKTSAQSSG
jgi:hypothetical protein